MPSKELNLLIVTTGLCINLYGLYGVKFGLPAPTYGGHFQYLTVCGLLVATLSTIARIINLLTGSMKNMFIKMAVSLTMFNNKYTDVYEALSAVATPIEGLITVLYWPIVFYDKRLLVPDNSTFNLPLSIDLCLHLFPTIVCWIDFLVFNKGFKRSPIHSAFIYVFTVFYFVWANLCYHHNNVWPYPLFAYFTDIQRAGFFLFCGTCCNGIYQITAECHSMLHSNNRSSGGLRKRG